MTVLLRIALLLSVLGSSLALSGCFVRSDRAYYQGQGNGYYRGHPHGGPPGQTGGHGHGHGHGRGRD